MRVGSHEGQATARRMPPLDGVSAARQSPAVRALLLGALLILHTALPGHAQAPSPPPLTLDEVMTAALSANPALAAVRLGRAEAQARGEVARQRPNPELSIEESKDYPRDSAVLSVPVERGGKRQRRDPPAPGPGPRQAGGGPRPG